MVSTWQWFRKYRQLVDRNRLQLTSDMVTYTLTYVGIGTRVCQWNTCFVTNQWRTEGVWGVQTPPRNSEILRKYQKLRKFYYMK
jgi:hypothetical protein